MLRPEKDTKENTHTENTRGSLAKDVAKNKETSTSSWMEVLWDSIIEILLQPFTENIRIMFIAYIKKDGSLQQKEVTFFEGWVVWKCEVKINSFSLYV